MLPELAESLQPWFVGALTLAMVGALLTGRFGTDIVFMGGLTAVVVTGVVEPGEAVAGFANPGLITVALLYVVAAGMKHTGAMTMLTTRLLGRPRTVAGAQARLALPVAGMSAFVNNTPIVAMFLPVLHGVSRRAGIPVSKLFMPLSFASILGGTCTLIGTSTNVIVAGLLISEDVRGHAGEPVRFGMFTLAAVGLPIAVVGLVYMLAAGRRLLPGDRYGRGKGGESREYMTAMRVAPGSPVVGKTIEQAGLRHLPGLYLSRIDRPDSTVVAVAPDTALQTGDVLVFVGDLEGVVDLQQFRGLEPIADEVGAGGPRHQRQLTEAVVSTASRVIGQTIRDAGFRARYGAVVVAVHRRGHRLEGKIGDIRLRAGDTLLLESEPGFADRYRDSRDFYLVTERAASAAPRHHRAWAAMLILAGLVAVITLGVLEPLPAALVAAGGMIIARCCTGPQARLGVDWPILVTIGAAFGMGEAIQQSGLADSFSSVILAASHGAHVWLPLAGVYLLTVVFTACMTNNAAAVLMFPIAMSVAAQTDSSPLAFAAVTAIAASCEFSTPIGYQTNLMVMGPGGYRWGDYTRFGGPLTLLAGVICVALAPLVY